MKKKRFLKNKITPMAALPRVGSDGFV